MAEDIKKRSIGIDLLKSISIIAVVLYHSGILKYGYLGVDVFLVIAGYFTTRSIIKPYLRGERLKLIKFLENRMIRLWPLALIVCIVSFLLAYLWMMPMALKNTSETVAGTSLFFNNFVQYITSSNYWDQSNEFKPLMHTWYVAMLLQFYLFYAITLWCVAIFSTRKVAAIKNTIFVIFCLSLSMYLLPILTVPQKFYLLPARLFEFAAGGLIVLVEYKLWQLNNKYFVPILFLLVIILLSINTDLGIEQIRLLLTVLLTQIALIYSSQMNIDGYPSALRKTLDAVAMVGIGSYSLYLWHQVVLAFYRYAFNSQPSWRDFVIIFIICAAVTVVSYLLLEKKLSSWLAKSNRTINGGFLACCMVTVALIASSAYVYKNKGIVRDVPELELYADADNNVTPEDYNSANYSLDIDFPKNEKKNCLVVGDSFGRDWLNILKEAYVDTVLNLSYHTDVDITLMNRIEAADIIFVANNGDFGIYYPLLMKMMTKRFYRVGYKYFTRCVGNVYNNNRYQDGYYSQSFIPDAYYEALIDAERNIFGEHYINLMPVIKNADGNYAHFTPDQHLYSEDGIHLTKAGAKVFAKRLNIKQYITD